MCRFFCSITCQNLEMAIFRCPELRAGIGYKTEKNSLFYSSPVYFTTAKSSGAASLKAATDSHKYPVCFKRWKFATKVVLYFHNINKLLFRRVVKGSLYSSTFYFSCLILLNYVASIHFEAAKKSKNSLLFLGISWIEIFFKLSMFLVNYST